jgi:DNA-directed RNA polymerase specialized sigma24 family protein
MTKYATPGRFAPGCSRSLARKAIDSHRSQARTAEPVPDPEPASPSVDAVAFVDDAVWEPVRRLPAKQRQAVTLRFLGDLSHREIAEVMQTSEAAARRNVFEALKPQERPLRSSPTPKEDTP